MQEGTTEGRRGRMLAVGLMLIALAVLALSAVFAQNDQVGRVIDEARALQASEELLATAVADRGAVAVAMLVGQAAQRGYATEDQLAATVEDVLVTSDALLTRGDRLDEILGGESGIGASSREVSQAARSTAALLVDGELREAQASAQSLVEALDRLERQVVEDRGAVYSMMVAQEGVAGRLVRGTSIAVGLLLPGSCELH